MKHGSLMITKLLQEISSMLLMRRFEKTTSFAVLLRRYVFIHFSYCIRFMYKNHGLQLLQSMLTIYKILQYGDKTMRQLFSRSYSSVYVHYVPLKGRGPLGTSAEIYKQTERLSQRIKSDTERVQ